MRFFSVNRSRRTTCCGVASSWSSTSSSRRWEWFWRIRFWSTSIGRTGADMREKITIGLAIAAGALLSYNLYQMFMVLPDEAMQGAIYRILFFHAPSAMVGMLGYFVALTLSVLSVSYT